MQDKRYIICGDVDYPVPQEFQETMLRFHLYGSADENKLTLDVQKMRASLFANIQPRFQDLLNIATYVFAADQRTKRGQKSDQLFDNNWHRHFHFVIPVRELDFWNSAEVMQCLQSTIGFLSDDTYVFEFVPMKNKPDVQEFLNINEDGCILEHPEQVVMFSGGLDSLGGAIEESLVQKRRVFLVNHRSTPKLDVRYANLEKLLAEKCGKNVPHHVRVTVHKKREMNNEHTQRSRSFLFISLGATIADIFNLRSVRFYENGVVSLNLPVCAQVVSGRATRTTHPKVIAGFKELLTLVSGQNFQVENPFLWKTKTDVIRDIIKADCANLIQHSVSCAHTWQMKTTVQSHCGTCSQCIDRRFAIIAADAEKHDPLEPYAIDIFTQGRENDIHAIEDRMMFATYIGRANRVFRTENAWDFLRTYPAVRRVLDDLSDSNQSASLERAFDLYKRHAIDIQNVLDTLLSQHRRAIRERTLPADSFLRMIYESALPECVPVTPILEEQPNNIFRKRGDMWELRFNGNKPFNLSSVDKGCEYIHDLITSPNNAINLQEIVMGGDAKKNKALLAQDNEITDVKALQSMGNRLREATEEREKARKNQEFVDVDLLTKEIDKLTTNIKNSSYKGKPRKDNTENRKVVNAFSGAVKRAIKKIGETDAALADHLTKSIQFGNNPVYQPAEPIQWETDPVVNS